ncbi:MAG: FAD-dependent oxidoreductase, partial [Anaerolineaceae bacterium]|nr:FAD-dependent oxidoreductase [Anaerolineaceae bacterium]
AHTVIIGAGIGGLTTAALLLQAGQRVTILEAHIYPGGSAGTFYNRGYRFDAGATLAGGFSSGGPHARLADKLHLRWPTRPVDPAWITHLPGQTITQWSDPTRWQEERNKAFPGTESFWRLQEKLADLAWDLSSRHFPWPPSTLADIGSILQALRARTLRAVPYLFSKVSDLTPGSAPPGFHTFLDAQLLISAQTTARIAIALYGSAALDLPRRGVNSVRGGIGMLAQTLVNWIRENGGEIIYRQPVNQILVRNRRVVGVRTAKGLELSCDFLVANLTPWALADLLAENAPPSLKNEVKRRLPTWGAFTLYLGLENNYIPGGTADHHQVICDPNQPLGEGNSVFISLSDASDPTRAPKGMRAATLSTHTAVLPWWAAASRDPQAYARRQAEYTERILKAAETALPSLRKSIRLCLPATPLTFQFYTRRPMGMVGGFPQTSLVKARGPATGLPNLWLVGDSVFPGQSTAGTTLGGWRVAENVIRASNH